MNTYSKINISYQIGIKGSNPFRWKQRVVVLAGLQTVFSKKGGKR